MLERTRIVKARSPQVSKLGADGRTCSTRVHVRLQAASAGPRHEPRVAQAHSRGPNRISALLNRTTTASGGVPDMVPETMTSASRPSIAAALPCSLGTHAHTRIPKEASLAAYRLPQHIVSARGLGARTGV